MSQESQLLDLVGCLYDAAAKAELWPVFLDKLADTIGSTKIFIFYHLENREATDIFSSVRGDLEWFRQYTNYYAGIDPWAAGGFRLNLKSGDVVTGERLCPGGDLARTEFFNDFLRKGHVFHQCCGVVFREPLGASVLSCMRPKRLGPFAEEQTRILQLLMPHMQRALQLHTRIAGLENRVSAIHEVLDRIPSGFILLDGAGKVLALNTSASEILRLNNGLAVNLNELTAGRSEDANRLRGLVRSAISAGSGMGIGSGGIMTLPRPSCRRPFQILVTPLRSRTSLQWPQTAAAAVFVSDPENQPEPAATMLQRLFHLTGAEARLAAALIEGKSLEETAAEFRVSRNTVRTQLRSVFDKTDTRRQGELIRLLWNSPAQLRLD